MTGNCRGLLRGWRLGAACLLGGNFRILFFLVSCGKIKKNQNKNKKILKYVTEQREGGDEVVFWLVV